MTDVDRRVAIRLTERRMAMGITQKELADMIGVSLSQISKYEGGRSTIAASRLFELAVALRIKPACLYHSSTGNPRPRPTRLVLELARTVVKLPRDQQAAMVQVARDLAAGKTASLRLWRARVRKRCTACGEPKPLSDFYHHNRGQCMTCERRSCASPREAVEAQEVEG